MTRPGALARRHCALPDRNPLDSAGKRAAFAGFYAPLHFLTTREVITGLGGAPSNVSTYSPNASFAEKEVDV